MKLNIRTPAALLAIPMALMLAAPQSAIAQAWPTKQPIKLVAVFPPGGSVDIPPMLKGCDLLSASLASTGQQTKASNPVKSQCRGRPIRRLKY